MNDDEMNRLRSLLPFLDACGESSVGRWSVAGDLSGDTVAALIREVDRLRGMGQGSNPAEAAHKDLALLKGATRAVCSAYERAVESGWLQVHQDAHDEAMLELIRLCPPGRAGAGLVESTMREDHRPMTAAAMTTASVFAEYDEGAPKLLEALAEAAAALCNTGQDDGLIDAVHDAARIVEALAGASKGTGVE